MVNDKLVWLVNKSNKTYETIIMELQKQVVFKPLKPVQLPYSVAQKYVNHSIHFCNHPEKYYKDEPMKHLTIRDAGIGDLLLLEPWLRESVNRNRKPSIASRYPDVFKYHPAVENNYSMKNKEDIYSYNINDFNAWDDLRNYSESCQSRAIKHRTDCYNEIYNFEVNDEQKEPRVYCKKGEKSVLKKKKGKTYIGINFDASHRFRKYHYGREFIDYVLKRDTNCVVVILGSYDYIKYKTHPNVIDLQGKTDIQQMFNVVVDLDYLVCADSGIMHVGLATHTPTVCLFSIIHPHLRVKYYTGPYRTIYPEHLECKGCGSFHMATCDKEGPKEKDEFVPPCMDIQPENIWEKIFEMEPVKKKRIFYGGEKKIISNTPKVAKFEKVVNINKESKATLTMPIIVQNEEKNLPRFIELVMSHQAIGRVVAIDGGSKDKTVKLLEKAGAEVYVHPYIKKYHEQQAMQRNISCSYVKNGQPILIMDIDECFSPELSDYLPYLAEQKQHKFGLVYRRTWNYYKDVPDVNKSIKDWPDPQPRYYIWDWSFKFVGGAHHITINTPEPFMIDKPIYHFEKEGKDRDALEKQWAGMMNDVRKLKGA